MEKEFKPIIQIRDENGRFCKPIELGEHFLSDIHAMESSLRWLGLQTVQVKNQINQLKKKKMNEVMHNERKSQNSKTTSPCKLVMFPK